MLGVGCWLLVVWMEGGGGNSVVDWPVDGCWVLVVWMEGGGGNPVVDWPVDGCWKLVVGMEGGGGNPGVDWPVDELEIGGGNSVEGAFKEGLICAGEEEVARLLAFFRFFPFTLPFCFLEEVEVEGLGVVDFLVLDGLFLCLLDGAEDGGIFATSILGFVGLVHTVFFFLLFFFDSSLKMHPF